MSEHREFKLTVFVIARKDALGKELYWSDNYGFRAIKDKCPHMYSDKVEAEKRKLDFPYDACQHLYILKKDIKWITEGEDG